MFVEPQRDDSENDNSLTDSPEDDSKKDVSPPDAAETDHLLTEDHDSHNESELDFFLFSCFYYLFLL